MSTPTKYESQTQPGLFFWAELNPTPKPGPGRPPAVESYCVMSQAAGGPAMEAHDDWLAHFHDADEIARGMALTFPAAVAGE